MHRWTWLVLVLGLPLGTGADESESGRTDGPEGSEYGSGGYSYYRTAGQYYIQGFFGAAQVDREVDVASDTTDNISETDLMGGLNVGYKIEDWLSFQLGYGYISDQKIGLFTVGMRNSYDLEPFNYFLSLDAELFSPDGGDSKFGIVPGAGAELVLNERLRVGLSYQHDFVFSDDNIDVDRFTARLQFKF